MNTKLRNALQKFQQGNTKQFSTIYEEVIHTVYDQIFETFQNESISQHITLHTMDCILNQLYTKNIEIEDLKTFEDQIHHITLGQIEKYQNLTTDNTKNPNFFTQLKLKLLNKLKEKKKANPTHIFFYFEHFRFYFTGFCIAAALGLIAFLLGFLTINKSPIIMSNPKLIVTTGAQAFGELKTLSEKEL